MMAFSNEKVAEIEVLVQVRNKGIPSINTDKSYKITHDSVSETADDDVTWFAGPCSPWSRRNCDVVAKLLLTKESVCMSRPSGSFPVVILS